MFYYSILILTLLILSLEPFFLLLPMRLVKQIPHDRFLIQIHQYNGKFILKIELSGFEQLFKIAETDILDIELLEKNLTPEFFSNCLKRFISMREDWNQLITQK